MKSQVVAQVAAIGAVLHVAIIQLHLHVRHAAMGVVLHVAIIQLHLHVRHAAMGAVLHVAIIQLRLHVRHAVMGVAVLVVITLRIPVPIAPLNVHRFVKVSPPKHAQIVLRDAVLVVAMIVIIHVPGCAEENAEHLAAENVEGNAVVVAK